MKHILFCSDQKIRLMIFIADYYKGVLQRLRNDIQRKRPENGPMASSFTITMGRITLPFLFVSFWTK